MAGNVFWAFLVHWCFLFVVSVRAVDVVSEPLPNPIQVIQDLSSKIVTAANGSDTIPGNVLPPAPLPYLPGVPLQPGSHARSNLTFAPSGGPTLAPEAAPVAAVIASAPAPELAQLLNNLTAAAAAALVTSPVASLAPAPAPGTATALAAAAVAEVPLAAAFAPAAAVNASLPGLDAAAAVAPAAAAVAPGVAALAPAVGAKASGSTSAQQPFSLNESIAAANASAAVSAVRSFQAAASSAVSAVTGNSTELPSLPLPSKPNANSTETGAIKDLVVASVKLGAALGESGKVTLLAADQRESFAARIKGDFESLSLAIANLPVGIIPFPDRAKAALQKLNTDIVHGVTSGNLDVVAIAADKDAVAAALAPVTDGTATNFGRLQ